MNEDRQGDWMVTASGKQVWPLDPRPGDFTVADIAHGLSMICRYGGHTREFYSVAQHSVLVSRITERYIVDGPYKKKWAFVALFHDAAEAYIGDMVRPLKRNMPKYKLVEIGIQLAIAKMLGIMDTDRPMPDAPLPFEFDLIKHADNVALITERRDLLTNPKPHGSTWKEDEQGIQAADWIPTMVPLDPVAARREFLARYEEVRA